MARILLATLGSYGDLHPYIAIGIELRRRGHRVTLATSAGYEAKIRAEELEFVAVRPDISLEDGAMLSYVMDARRGPERVVRFLAAEIRKSYQDTLGPAKASDLVVTHPITFGAVLAAQKVGVPWISSVFAPFSFLSAYDPPVLGPLPWAIEPRSLGRVPTRWMIRLAKLYTRSWIRPLLELRKELGWEAGGHPLFEGQHAPLRVLALFSKCLAHPQPDWPPQTVLTGFPFYDRHHEQATLSPDSSNSWKTGPRPWSSRLVPPRWEQRAIFIPSAWRRPSASACARCFDGTARARFAPGCCGVVRRIRNCFLARLDRASRRDWNYGASHAEGGRAMLVVPFAHDQFDNAARVKRLGIGEVLRRDRYTVGNAERLLRRLADDSRYAQACTAIAKLVRAENGAKAAADAIDAALASASPGLPLPLG